jgi:ketosteroid isomerase-like protein
MVAATGLRELENAYRAWHANKGSTAEPWFDLMRDDVRFRSIAGGAQAMLFTRPHSGKQAVRAYFEELANDWQMIFYHVRTFLVQDDRVAVVGECCWRHKRTGKLVHTPKLDVIRFAGEKMADFFEYFDTAQAMSACAGNNGVQKPASPKPLIAETGAQTIEGDTAASRAGVSVLKEVYRRWNDTKGKSVAEITDILAPHVSWGSLANGADGLAFTSRKMSRAEVGAYFQGLAEAFEMKFYRADEFLAAGDFVLMIGSCSFTNKATGKTFETPKADLWRFSGDKAVEFFEYYDTAAVLATTQ